MKQRAATETVVDADDPPHPFHGDGNNVVVAAFVRVVFLLTCLSVVPAHAQDHLFGVSTTVSMRSWEGILSSSHATTTTARNSSPLAKCVVLPET
jgi:hypothetical protein